jgi:hypothetical protein
MKNSTYSYQRDQVKQIHGKKTRLIAFFVDEKQLTELPNNPIKKMDILEGRKLFDMRKLHSFSLLTPGIKVIPTDASADDTN